MVSSAASTDAGSVNIVRQPIMDGSGRVFAYSQILGLIFVLALVVFATYNDILRLV